MDCFVADAPLRKRFAFAAGNDAWRSRGSAHLGQIAIFSMDCRVKPGNNEIRKELSMRRNLALALLLIAPLLAGCLERGQPTMVDTSADDDAFCRANNVAVGSNDYVNCRKNRDVQRGNANARTDRAQRNLAEQMLNNPTRP
jgi:hypothetical protein